MKHNAAGLRGYTQQVTDNSAEIYLSPTYSSLFVHSYMKKTCEEVVGVMIIVKVV